MTTTPQSPPAGATTRHGARRRRWWPWIAGAAALFLLVLVISAAARTSGRPAPGPTPPLVVIATTSPAAPVAASVAPGATLGAPTSAGQPPVAAQNRAPSEVVPNGAIGNGSWLIGGEIPIGRYRSAGPDPADDPPLCYYDVTDDTGKIVDQGVDPDGPARVDLRKRAGMVFTSRGCLPWSRS